MQVFLSLIVETSALVLAVTLIAVSVSMVSNPTCPAWLKASGMDNLLALILVSSVSFAVAFEINGMVNLKVPVLVAMGVTAAVVAGVGIAAWKLTFPLRRVPAIAKTPMSGSTPLPA